MLVSRSFIFAFVLNPKVILNVALKSELLIISKSGIIFNLRHSMMDVQCSMTIFYLTLHMKRHLIRHKKWTKRGKKWRKIGKNNLHVPKIAGDAGNLCRIRTAGYYLSMIMSRFAWIAKKRKKNDRITKTCPNRWSQPAWKQPTNLMEIRPVTASTTFALLSARRESGVLKFA